MREYKFRGKALSEDLGWQYGNIIHVNHLPNEVLIGFSKRDEHGKLFQHGILVDKKTVGQSTGLFDKNGIEIWENDKVKHDDYGILQVYFLYGAFHLSDGDENGSCFDLNIAEEYNNDMLYNVEVIGNIHEVEE